MADLGSKKISENYQKLLQISDDGVVSDGTGSNVGLSLPTTGNLSVTGHISASGNISSSGTIYASKFESTGTSDETISFTLLITSLDSGESGAAMLKFLNIAILFYSLK